MKIVVPTFELDTDDISELRINDGAVQVVPDGRFTHIIYVVATPLDPERGYKESVFAILPVDGVRIEAIDPDK